ncbi:MAG: phosphotransferase family protein [Acidimicrobiia bacterium]
MTLPAAAVTWVSSHAGPVTAVRRLPGATSSIVCEVESEDLRFILRLFDNEEWLAREPDLAEHEAAVLELIAVHDIPAPELIAVDRSGEQAGTPAVLMSKIRGAPVIAPTDIGPWLDGLLDLLPAIASIDAAELRWGYEPWIEEDAPIPPPWSTAPAAWEEAAGIGVVWDVPSSSRLAHRDYHFANVLWDRGAPTGVVDWVNACRGPVEIDVAHCAQNVGQLHGPDTAMDLVRRWETLSGTAFDPRWLLRSALETGSAHQLAAQWAGLGVHHPAVFYQRHLDALVVRALAEVG